MRGPKLSRTWLVVAMFLAVGIASLWDTSRRQLAQAGGPPEEECNGWPYDSETCCCPAEGQPVCD